MNARRLSLVALALAAALAAGCRGDREEVPPVAAIGDHDHAHQDHAGHEPGAVGASGAAAAADEIAHYTCSMHPSVRNAEPGICPICAMSLAPVFRRELESGEIVLDQGRRQLIGVTTARAELRPLSVRVRALGAVTYDESRLTDVTLKAGGWIDELYADRLGQRVKAGAPLFTLYSPELFEVQQKYVDALENLDNARKLRSPLIADLLIETRRQRLRLSDLGADQLESLEERGLPVERIPILAPASGHVIEKNVVAGAAVAAGARLLRIAGLDRVWVEAGVYESELGLLGVGDAATVTLPHLPGRTFSGRIGFVYPWLDGATRTGRVRIELANPGLALKPEMHAEVVLEPSLGERLAVPEEAILYGGERRYVFLDLGGGRLRPRAVTLGHRAGEWVEVLDGLTAGDLVVTSGNFLIAAEARLKLALDHWNRDSAGAPPGPPSAEHAGHQHPAPPTGRDAHHDHQQPAPPTGRDAHHDHQPPAPPAEHDAHHDHQQPAPPAGHDDHREHRDPAGTPEHHSHQEHHPPPGLGARR